MFFRLNTHNLNTAVKAQQLHISKLHIFFSKTDNIFHFAIYRIFYLQNILINSNIDAFQDKEQTLYSLKETFFNQKNKRQKN